MVIRKIIEKPEAVLFDWDNTLIDSWETNRQALNTVYRHFRLPELSIEEVKARPQLALQDSFPIVFGERWQEAKQIYYESYRNSHLELLTPHQNAEELLSILSSHSIYTAVVSNKLGDNLRLEVKHLGWERYFQTVVGSRDTHTNKPNPAPAEKALSEFSTTSGKHIWFIGDSPVDMHCALHINATAIFLGNESNLPEAMKINPSLDHYNNLKEIIDIIQKLLNKPQ